MCYSKVIQNQNCSICIMYLVADGLHTVYNSSYSCCWHLRRYENKKFELIPMSIKINAVKLKI